MLLPEQLYQKYIIAIPFSYRNTCISCMRLLRHYVIRTLLPAICRCYVLLSPKHLYQKYVIVTSLCYYQQYVIAMPQLPEHVYQQYDFAVSFS